MDAGKLATNLMENMMEAQEI